MFKNFVLALLFAALFTAAPKNYNRILLNMGYKAEENPSEIVEVTIPEEWDGVYNNYNALQMEGGFDLTPYKGRTCTRYTYEIPDKFARGNVLVYNGEVIGGDVCSITLDGIMLPIEKDKLE
ncbi:MAG: DUF4830 domain-containing protein [Clostridia bacterium]